MVRSWGINEAWWLRHVYLFIVKGMKEGVLNIQLPNGPSQRSGNGKNYTDSDQFNDRAESFIKIDTFLLSVSLCQEACFVPINWPIQQLLDLIDTLATNNLSMKGGGTRSHVLLSRSSFYSFCIAATQQELFLVAEKGAWFEHTSSNRKCWWMLCDRELSW